MINLAECLVIGAALYLCPEVIHNNRAYTQVVHVERVHEILFGECLDVRTYRDREERLHVWCAYALEPQP